MSSEISSWDAINMELKISAESTSEECHFVTINQNGFFTRRDSWDESEGTLLFASSSEVENWVLDYWRGCHGGRKMTSLVEQTARVLSGSRPSVQEKSLSDAEIEDLWIRERSYNCNCKRHQEKWGRTWNCKDVLDWIRDVRKTWNKNNSLHPNA